MTIERGANDAFERQPENYDATRESSVDHQRLLALAFGSGLLLGATSRRSVPLALAGALLTYRGATGRWAFAGWLRRGRTSTRVSVPHETGVKVERALTIQKTPEEVYRFWRDLENLPRFMGPELSVRRLSNLRSHWKFASVGGAAFEWDAEIINDIPDKLIAWRSLEGADMDHAGSVHFENDGRGGTRVKVVMEYRPPAGKLGAGLARVFGQEPGQVLETDLHRLKQLMESGEIATVEGLPRGD